MNEKDRKQVNVLIEALLDVVVESDHINFTDLKVPHENILKINNYCFTMMIWLEDNLNEEKER